MNVSGKVIAVVTRARRENETVYYKEKLYELKPSLSGMKTPEMIVLGLGKLIKKSDVTKIAPKRHVFKSRAEILNKIFEDSRTKKNMNSMIKTFKKTGFENPKYEAKEIILATMDIAPNPSEMDWKLQTEVANDFKNIKNVEEWEKLNDKWFY